MKEPPTKSNLELPSKNVYIDRHPKLIKDSDRERRLPDLFLLLDRIGLKIWYKPSSHVFYLPKGYIYIKFLYGQSSCTVKQCSFNNLLSFLIKDALGEHIYQAELAGIYLTLKSTKYGLELAIRGFSGKLPIFLTAVFDIIFGLIKDSSSETRFKNVLEIHRNVLKSSEAESLSAQIKHFCGTVLCPQSFNRGDRLKQLHNVEFIDIVEYAQDFFDHMSFECLFYGNFNPDQIKDFSNIIIQAKLKYLENREMKDISDCDSVSTAVANNPYLEDWFTNDPIEKIVGLEYNLFNRQKLPANVMFTEHQLPPDRTHLFLINNEIQKSSCVLYYLQYCTNTPENNSVIETFFHLIRGKLVGYLKHVVPLGYAINVDIRRINQTLGLRIIVESQYPLSVVYETINRGIDSLDEYLNELKEDPEILENIKKSIVLHKREQMSRMNDTANLVWREIADASYNFKRIDGEIKCLEMDQLINAKLIHQFYRNWIHTQGSERRCLILSIGPDPMVNEIPGMDSMTLDKVHEVKWTKFPTISHQQLSEWYYSTFNSNDGNYSPPF